MCVWLDVRGWMCVYVWVCGWVSMLAYIQVRVNMTFDIRDESVPGLLRLVHPKIEYTLGLSRKVQIIEALQVRSIAATL